MDATGNEKVCANCVHWQPNGGVLGMGYCIEQGWVYRKPDQSCEKFETAHMYVFSIWKDDQETMIGVKATSLESASKFVHDRFGEKYKFEFRYE